ncbi:hypothetical protein [Caballeronia sp. DA-9]|uniref:hypothetical protein n=1 Tax=Caballeronia sp. DA-9 TaxID=3436237 RepID=UPI003F66BD9C
MTVAKQELSQEAMRRGLAHSRLLRPSLHVHRHAHTGTFPADDPSGGRYPAFRSTGIGQSGCCTRADTRSRNGDRENARPTTTHTFSLEERLRNWGSERRGLYDPVDARLVDAAWRRLPVRHRELLQMVYLWKAGREVVCRRLKIRRHPAQVFELEVAAAKAALKKIVDA